MCFSVGEIEHLLIMAVVFGAFILLMKLLLPLVLAYFGWGGAVLMQIINIIVGAAVIIFLIIVAFELFSCLLNSGVGLRLH